MCTAKYPTDFLYLISRTDFVNQSLKLLTICFFNKVYILFLFVILKCHMVADTNPQYVAIVLSDHSWKQHNYPNGDLTFHWVLMDCFLSTFLIKKKKKKREMLLSKLAVYILSGNGKIFRPESGYIPTVCSASRVMMSWFSQGGLEISLMVSKIEIWNVKVVLLSFSSGQQSQPIFGMHLILHFPTWYE